MNRRLHIPALLSLAALLFSFYVQPPLFAAGREWLSIDGSGKAGPPRTTVSKRPSGRGLGVTMRLRGASRSSVTVHATRYDQLGIPGCGSTAERVGLPELPFKGFFLEIPYGVDVQISLSSLETVSLGAGYTILPLQQPLPDTPTGEDPPFELDEAAYSENEFYPAEAVVTGEPGFIRGRRVIFVQVFPLQYNPATTELRAFASTELNVEFIGTPDERGAARRRRLAGKQWNDLARRLILNYEPVEPEGESSGPGEGASPAEGGVGMDLSTSDAADYLIITADSLYDEVLPLAEWKHKKGFITRVVQMSEVGSTAADVDSYIQNAYDTWSPAPSYVLLVGDHEDIPADYYSGTLSCYSDLTFSCTDGTDYYPDITLGRLPVRTDADCTNVVNKILQYDRTPDSGSWYDDFLSAGYFQDNDNGGYADRWFMETTVTVRNFLRDTVGYTTHTAWTTSSSGHSAYHYRSSSYPHRFAYPDPVPSDVVNLWTSASQSTADITTAINNGVSLVQHRDHGGQTGWGDPPYYNSNVNSLSNGVMTPVVLSINCQTGSFHMSGGDSFCEAFIKKSPGGSVAIVGATRNSYSGYNDLLVHGIYTGFWPSYDSSHSNATYPHSLRPAEALNYGKYYMLTYEGTGSYTEGQFYMFHYFGDPEMMLRTTSPATLSVTHPAVIFYTFPTDVTVTVSSGGSPVEGALVAISFDGAPDDYWTGTTNASGEVTFADLTASQTGDYDIVVTAHDGEPYESTITSSVGSDGMISLDAASYSCSDNAEVAVYDADIAGAGTQDVELTTTGGDTETLQLSETGPATGAFIGTVSMSSAAVQAEDGTLQVSNGETITATYIDADDGQGGTNVTKTDDAAADCQDPVISGVSLGSIDEDSATITWTTDEAATGEVRYGTSPASLDGTGEDTALSTNHSVALADLPDGTRYYFEVAATDAVGHEVTDTNGGAYYAFTTDVFYGCSTGFEEGTLGSEWTAESSLSEGRIQVTTANSPNGGSYHVTMDRNPSGSYNQNDLTLLVDLSSVSSNAVLSYWCKEFSDETHSQDGVSISNDGSAFTKIQSHDCSSTYTEIVIDLAAAAASAGLTLDVPLYIRWTQYDNFPIPTDGIAVDDVVAGGYMAVDTDGDGTPDNTDADDDNDGLSDDEEVRDYGTDPVSSDTDGDGLSDGDEINTHGTEPLDSDTDGDGLSDGDEINTYGTLATDADTDGDGYADRLEAICGGGSTATNPDAHPPTLCISFQPSASSPPQDFVPGSSGSYRSSYGYGWR